MGKVQRIGLRYQIKEQAEVLGLQGYTRNLRDGSVSIEIEGTEQSLDVFIDWIKASPGLSKVQEVSTTEGETKHYRDFQVY